MLITLSKDKSIKFWRFPKTWIDESQITERIDPGQDQNDSEDGQDDSSDEDQLKESKSPR